jgi:hypothetical protein
VVGVAGVEFGCFWSAPVRARRSLPLATLRLLANQSLAAASCGQDHRRDFLRLEGHRDVARVEHMALLMTLPLVTAASLVNGSADARRLQVAPECLNDMDCVELLISLTYWQIIAIGL